MSSKKAPFEGDLGRATDRLRELTERACDCLDAEQLNVLSFHIAAYLDVDLAQRRETDRMRAELASEQEAIETAGRALDRERAEDDDTKFLGELGIDG